MNSCVLDCHPNQLQTALSTWLTEHPKVTIVHAQQTVYNCKGIERVLFTIIYT
jgi:hypothetical protein